MRLAAGGDLELARPVEDRHLDLGAQRELRERDGQVAVEVGALADEQIVLGEAHQHVQVPGRPAVTSSRPLAGEAHLHAVLDAGGGPDPPYSLPPPAAL